MRDLFHIVLCLFLFACATPVENEIYNPSATIEDVWKTFIDHWESKNAKGCIEAYHNDITFIPQGFATSNSVDSVAAFYTRLFESNESSHYTHKTLSLAYSKDLAVEQAQFIVDWTSLDGEKWTFKARMLNEWIPDSEGNWKIKTLIFNTDPTD
ncbi:MAG TPA: hypothetical protein PKC30_16270 [Saprospiraceae bacterium]|nr:hypothetical protein [Saprospiraceae bacterium]